MAGKLLAAILMLLMTAQFASAQYFGIAYTSTSLDWDAEAGVLEADCTIILDYTAEAYYQTATNCYIYHDSNIPANIVDNDWGYGYNYATVNLEYEYATPNTSYGTQGTFFVTLPYYYYDVGHYWYFDPYDYRYYTWAGISEWFSFDFWGFDYADYVVDYETLFLGYVYDGVTTGAGKAHHVKVVTDNHGVPPSCASTGIYVRQMHMQVVDSQSNPIDTNASIVETYDQRPTNTCTNQQIPDASPCEATGDGGTGRFIDTMAVDLDFCGSGISQSSSCGFSLTSTWSACSGGNSAAIWTSTRVTHANGVAVNGTTSTYSSGTNLWP